MPSKRIRALVDFSLLEVLKSPLNGDMDSFIADCHWCSPMEVLESQYVILPSAPPDEGEPVDFGYLCSSVLWVFKPKFVASSGGGDLILEVLGCTVTGSGDSLFSVSSVMAIQNVLGSVNRVLVTDSQSSFGLKLVELMNSMGRVD